MGKIEVYHNKRCTKSNQALHYLAEKGMEDIDVVLYLDNPISSETAKKLVQLLGEDYQELIRIPDAKKLGVEIPKEMSKEWVAKIIVEVPKVMQRPVVVANGKAIIARPTEKIDLILV
ncbi:MAG TPA: ArsC/Spx/MgsR family protein [Taishania sp.]|nr:ArsC/Spx/MgsR family protein [Taishania sp.]